MKMAYRYSLANCSVGHDATAKPLCHNGSQRVVSYQLRALVS